MDSATATAMIHLNSLAAESMCIAMVETYRTPRLRINRFRPPESSIPSISSQVAHVVRLE